MARDSVLSTAGNASSRFLGRCPADNTRLHIASVVSLALHVGLVTLIGHTALVPEKFSPGKAQPLQLEARLAKPLAQSPSGHTGLRELSDLSSSEPVADVEPGAKPIFKTVPEPVTAPFAQQLVNESAIELPAPALALPSADVRELYLPTRYLDSSPIPEEPVTIAPGNDVVWDERKGTVMLVLYVAETGAVDFIDTEDHDVPANLVALAVEAFRGAKMLPATKDGSPAKARMKVLVEFHQTPVPHAS